MRIVMTGCLGPGERGRCWRASAALMVVIWLIMTDLKQWTCRGSANWQSGNGG